MDKQIILDEIRRTAKANDGQPLGRERFVQATGIKPYDWQMYWPSLGDAQKEAGFAPNELQSAYDESFLLERLASLTRELGRLPTEVHIRIKKRNDPEFPSKGAFARLGSKLQIANRLAAYCGDRAGYEDVLRLCAVKLDDNRELDDAETIYEGKIGYVYLFKSGRDYKIGFSYSPGRRESELNAGAPQGVTLIHQIKTDDPEGVEKYWHSRFVAKRKRDRHEWFELTPTDVRAFRRWRNIF